MIKYWRIGDFSKKIGVSSEFLKYYDKQNLIKPIWKDEMSYRYYADFQTVHLNEYYRLSRIGLSLNESKRLIQTGSLDDFLEAYTEKTGCLQEQLETLTEDVDYARSFSSALKKIKHHIGWTIEYLPDYLFVSYQQDSGAQPHPRQDESLKKSLVCQRVIVTTDDEMQPFSYCLKEGAFQRSWGFLEAAGKSFEVGNSNTKTTNSGRMIQQFVKGGRFFLLCHAIPAVYDSEGKLADLVWNFAEPLEILKKHDFSIRGDLYQERLCVCHEEDGDYLLARTLIPLLS